MKILVVTALGWVALLGSGCGRQEPVSEKQSKVVILSNGNVGKANLWVLGRVSSNVAQAARMFIEEENINALATIIKGGGKDAEEALDVFSKFSKGQFSEFFDLYKGYSIRAKQKHVSNSVRENYLKQFDNVFDDLYPFIKTIDEMSDDLAYDVMPILMSAESFRKANSDIMRTFEEEAGNLAQTRMEEKARKIILLKSSFYREDVDKIHRLSIPHNPDDPDHIEIQINDSKKYFSYSRVADAMSTIIKKRLIGQSAGRNFQEMKDMIKRLEMEDSKILDKFRKHVSEMQIRDEKNYSFEKFSTKSALAFRLSDKKAILDFIDGARQQ